MQKFKTSIVTFVILCFSLIMLSFVNIFVSKITIGRFNPYLIISYMYIFKNFIIIISFVILLFIIYFFILKDPKLSFIDTIIENRFLICFILFIFTLIFSIHGFSLVSWDRFINTKDGINIIYGMPRDITSDVWALGLPAIFSQIENNFNLYNYTIMSNGANALVLGLPVENFTMIARPFTIGYILFGKNIGLSWHYFSKLFFLILSTYEISYFLSKNDKKIALAFTFIITFSPAIQWWFTQGIVDSIIYFQICVATIIYYINHISSIKVKLVSVLILTIGGSGFITSIYPPLQVPLAYLFLILVFMIIFDNYKFFKPIDIFVVFLIIFIVFLICYNYFLLSYDGFQMLLNTSYPAKRFELGGNFEFNNMFYYFFQFLLPLKSASFSNNCEMASFLLIFPVILLAFPFGLKKKFNVFHLILFMYELFLISWLFIEYPSFFAKISLFSFVTESRLLLVIGLIGCYLTIILMSIFSEKGGMSKFIGIFISSISFFLALISKKYDTTGYLNFLGKADILVILFSSVIIVLFSFFIVVNHKRKSMLILIAVTFISGFFINPISYGTGPLYKSKLSAQISLILEENPHDFWIFDDDFPYSNYLLSHNIKSFNALNSYPDYNKWLLIDPDEKYKNIYNRYAHVGVNISDKKTILYLEAPDSIKIELNFKDLAILDVKYVVSKQNLEYYGFKLLYKDEISGFNIYI